MGHFAQEGEVEVEEQNVFKWLYSPNSPAKAQSAEFGQYLHLFWTEN